METSYIWVLLSLSLIALVPTVTGQQAGQSQCQLRFRQSATACMQNSSFNIANVQYMASNGTTGTPPSENLQVFKQRVCLVKPQLEICGQSVTQRLINSTLCMGQQPLILSSFQTTFGGLDSNCALPCRYSLMDELRQCYSFININNNNNNNRNFNLRPTMISDMALLKEAMIGNNYDQVYHFCRNRNALVQCMQQKVLTCRDSARVLAQYDLDLRSFERGIDMLCDNIGLYLAGIHCFKNPIPEVRMCYQTLDRRMQNLRQIAPQPTADQLSLAQFCSIRLEQIDCEMGAWSRHQYQTCERVVTGMRNELACKLLPDRCRAAFPQMVTNLCNPLNYFQEDRWRYNSAERRELPLLSLIGAALFSFLWRM